MQYYSSFIDCLLRRPLSTESESPLYFSHVSPSIFQKQVRRRRLKKKDEINDVCVYRYRDKVCVGLPHRCSLLHWFVSDSATFITRDRLMHWTVDATVLSDNWCIGVSACGKIIRSVEAAVSRRSVHWSHWNVEVMCWSGVSCELFACSEWDRHGSPRNCLLIGDTTRAMTFYAARLSRSAELVCLTVLRVAV